MSALDRQIAGNHYKDMPIQPIEFITKNKLDWYQGNIIKYATRHHNKGGAEDLRKVIHYAELALEAQYSAPVPEAPTGGSGWIEWKGGARPVPEGARVEVKMRDGTGINDREAGDFDWSHDLGGVPGDIMAYRVVKPVPEVPAGGSGWVAHTSEVCPVPGDTLVRVRFWSGAEYFGSASAFEWATYAGGERILEYWIEKGPEVSTEDDEWIEWTGGACPVSDETVVVVKLRDGEGFTGTAARLRWRHSKKGCNAAGDIMAYRVVKPVPEAPTEDDEWIEWKGGVCPVSAVIEVAVKYRNGVINVGYARGFSWTHPIVEGNDWDIMAYRIVA